MPYTIDRLPDIPVVMVIQSGSQVVQEMPAILDQLIPLLDEQPEPVFLIIDVRGISIGLEDITVAANMTTDGSEAALHHPNVRETLVISTDGTVRLAAQGLRSDTFGRVKIEVFNAPEQALDYCQERLAEAASGSNGSN